jgi:outer membrane receptor protein involved in Fe transport
MGGTFRRTSDYDKGFIPPPNVTLGIANNDPAANVISLANIPGLRNADLATARSLYAMLVGRISNASGSMNVNPDTGQYEQIKVPRNEAQNIGGLYAQDQWRVKPTLTLNYGLRWSYWRGANRAAYSAPTVAELFGPSSAIFQPGVLNGVADPQVHLRPKPYKGDFNNPAPNVGIAWNPDKPKGFLGRLLGKSVYRGNFGISYYDEGLIAFESAAGNGPGATQTSRCRRLRQVVNLQTPLPAFTRNPETFVPGPDVRLDLHLASQPSSRTSRVRWSTTDARLPARALA